MHIGRFFSAHMKSKQNYELVHWNVSKLPSVHILVIANLDIHVIVSNIENYENRTVTPISVNNNSVQQNAINLVPIMPNSTIALFPYSNIQGNVTINFCGKKWKDLDLWFILKMMFNSCDKYCELYCWLLHVIYFVVILINKHKFFI